VADSAAGETLALHPATVTRYLDSVRRLHELLVKGNAEVPGAADEAIAVLRGLIREVIVHPADDDGFEVEIKGELAAFTDSGVFPNRSRGASKAVAGARYSPTSTLEFSRQSAGVITATVPSIEERGQGSQAPWCEARLI